MSKLSKSMDLKLASLPDKANRGAKWTLEEDAALLKYADAKGVRAVAEALGKSRNAAYDRYQHLKKMVNNAKS